MLRGYSGGNLLRWHVHGTDVATGQPVTLAVNETHATDAVQTALSKRIVVSHVTRQRLRRVVFPFTCAAVVVLAPLCAGLYWYEQNLRQQLRSAESEQTRLTASLSEAEAMINNLKATGSALPDNHTLTTAIAHAAAAEKKLEEANLQIAANHDLTARVEADNIAVTSLRRHVADLESQQKQDLQTAVDAALAGSQNRITALQSENKDLASRIGGLTGQIGSLTGQIDALKSQLLVAAAKSTPIAEPKPEEESAPALPAVTRWAMRTDFDAASDFMALHFDKETLKTQPQPDGTLLWSGLSVANASTLRILHDSAKHRVYSVTLTVSLAPDAPKSKLDENLALVTQTLKTFAPATKDPAAHIARITAELADKDATQRTILLTDDAKITVWNNRTGEFTWCIESPGNDAGG
jgi:hypothetical protein